MTRRAGFGLQARLVAITMLVLAASLGAIGWGLDRSFRAAVAAGVSEQLRAAVFNLLSAAVEREDRLVFDALSEPRLHQAGTGFYAYVDERDGEVMWRSPSLDMLSGSRVGAELPIAKRPAPGEFRFDRTRLDAETPRFVMAYSVFWEPLDAELTFWVLADQRPAQLQVAAFRRNAAAGLVLAAAVLAGIQLAALRWGLRPLRAMVERVRRVEAGAKGDIGTDYPRELLGLARNLNRFIAVEKDNRERYRRAMDDLAHSLKTPLAVIKNELREGDPSPAGLLREQLDRMESAVSHQLARAAAVRTALPAAAIAVLPIARRIARALERAYADKGLAVEVAAEPRQPAASVRVDERDLMDMLGNLMENAFKFAQGRVRVVVQARPGGVRVAILDDGPGIAPEQRQRVLARGARAAADAPGQGIGLAVVTELATVYGGRLTIGDGDLGGAAVCLALPVDDGGR